MKVFERSDLRTAVADTQRGRLLVAMADVVGGKGYGDATVADVIAAAGVSRKTFYEHFADKRACFLAAYEHGTNAMIAEVAAQAAAVAGWRERVEAALTAFLSVLAAEPGFARAFLVEIWAAGPEANARHAQVIERFHALLRALHEEARAENPAIVPASDAAIAAVTGGISRVATIHVLNGRAAELPELGGRSAAVRAAGAGEHGELRVKRLALLALLGALAPATASAATLEVVDIPSRHVNAATANFNPGGALKATVFLPDGYDAQRAYPLLLLLHGVGDNYAGWASPEKGDILRTAAGFPGIIVMPEGAKGFYTDWWNGGRRGDPGWESYILDEVLPAVRARYRIRSGRANHAIAGVSMGGLGAALLAARRPGFFGSVAVISGFVDHQRPEVSEGGMQLIAGVDYKQLFGERLGFYATGRNPTQLPANLATLRVWVGTGDGDLVASENPVAGVAEGAIVRPQVDAFVAALRRARVPYGWAPRPGGHDWPTFRAELRDAIAWGVFGGDVRERPETWSSVTVGQQGELFDVRYRLDAAPDGLVRFSRDAGGLAVGGVNGQATLNVGGCELRLAVPGQVALPCPRLRLRVSPRRVRAGRRVRLRVCTGVAGARVRAGGASGVTGATGCATLHPRWRARGRRTVIGEAPGRRPGRATVRR